ncbi:hypothetical protein Hanom_Chr01g00031121 [Helianthus anomalus]
MYQIVISIQFFKMAYEGLTKMPNFLPFCSLSVIMKLIYIYCFLIMLINYCHLSSSHQ